MGSIAFVHKIFAKYKGFLRPYLCRSATQKGFQFCFIIFVISHILKITCYCIISTKQNASCCFLLLCGRLMAYSKAASHIFVKQVERSSSFAACIFCNTSLLGTIASCISFLTSLSVIRTLAHWLNTCSNCIESPLAIPMTLCACSNLSLALAVCLILIELLQFF